MKYLFLSLVSLLGLALCACNNNRGKDLNELDNPSATDSLLFYYTQLRAYEYWDQAEKDTTLRNHEARQQFIKGFIKGFDAISDKNNAYNKGVELGVRLATNILKFEKLYGIDLNKDVVVAALENGLRDDAVIPEFEYQEQFYRILSRIRQEQRRNDHEKARNSLIEEARHRNMTMITDDLFYSIIKKGEGPYAEYGNSVFVNVIYERADGEDIVIPSPGMVTIGSEGMPNALCKAYTHLNKGEVAMFATTAEAVFGSRTYVMGMKPEDILLLTITLNEIFDPHGDDQSNTDQDNSVL